MMQTFTKGLDKIYYDLDNIDDLNNKLRFEGRFKDTAGKVLPWAAAAALGYGIMQYDPQMSNQEKFDNASAIFQFTVISDQGDPNESAKQFVQFALTLPSKDRKRLRAQIDEFKTNIPVHQKARMDKFQERINYWVNQFNTDRWSKRDDSLAVTPPRPEEVPAKKSPWAPGPDKPAGWKDPRGFRGKEGNNMKRFKTFENKVSGWVPEVKESTGDAGAYADTWLHDHRDELETADEGIGIEDVIDRLADDYADAIGEPVDNEAAQEIVNVVVPALTDDYGWVLDPNSDILSRYTAVDEVEEPEVEEPRPTGVPLSPFDDHVRVPARVEGQPWVHSDDDFNLFLEWLLKKEWTARQIVDVVAKPYKPYVIEQYKEYLDQRERQELDPLL